LSPGLGRAAAPALLALATALAGCPGGDPGPEPLGQVPGFSLLDQRGERFEGGSLRGRVWVADFVFTRCAGACPLLSARMARLQQHLAGDASGADVRLVSFSVDPEHDRPPVLAGYASRLGADPGRWVFLTGGRAELWELSSAGFKLPVGEAPGDPDEPLFHSQKLVLVDRSGRIRGYYDALEDEGFEALERDLRRLAAGSD
jgi:protein SCO1/2